MWFGLFRCQGGLSGGPQDGLLQEFLELGKVMGLGVVAEGDADDARFWMLHDEDLRECVARLRARCTGEDFDWGAFWIRDEVVEFVGDLEAVGDSSGHGVRAVFDGYFEFAIV